MLSNKNETARRPRVLMLAYAATPYHGSECAAGWNRAVQVAQHCDTWVICEQRECEDDIRRYIEEHGPIDGLHFEFLAKSAVGIAIGSIPGLYYLSYNLWHRRAYRLAKQLHERIQFDLVHQANMCGYREPGYLWKLDAPFVWGPVGGTQNYPNQFLSEAGWYGAVSEFLRTSVNELQLRYSQRVRRTAQRADAMLVANSTIQRDFERAFGVQSTTLVETGLSTPIAAPKRHREPGPLHILWSGEIYHWKALTLLIKALALLPSDIKYEVRILGTGAQRHRCQKLAHRLGVSKKIEWMGWIPYSQAQKQYDWADVFAFTSLRDTTGTVVCEALGAGLPVLCLDHQGVGDIVNENCGIKIPVETPSKVIAGLSGAIADLARDPRRVKSLSDGARQRATSLQWSYLGERTVEIYEGVLASRASIRPKVATFRDNAEQKVKELAKLVASKAGAGLNRVLGAQSNNSLGLLLYHSVAPNVQNVARAPFNVSPGQFKSQISGLLQAGYEFAPLSRVLEHHEDGNALPQNTVVLTFDDGFESVFTNAFPVLREFDIPATVFLSTAYLDSNEPFPFDDWAISNVRRAPAQAYRPLSTSHCHQMLSSGLIEFGAHTHTHQDFRGRAGEFHTDLVTCVDFLRDEFGLNNVPFAFPFGKPCLGYTSQELVNSAKDVGVTCGLTTEDVTVDPDGDPFEWGRFNVYEFDTPETIAGKLNGWYSWAPRMREWFAVGGAS